MGTKVSQPAPVQSTVSLHPITVTEPAIDPPVGVGPNIRSKYLARIGLGEAGAALQRYQGMTVQDFKVPKWLQGYRSAPLTEEQKEGEVKESIASNDSYSLSFVQAKSNDEIRMHLFQRMSSRGFWVPQSERGPNSQSSMV